MVFRPFDTIFRRNEKSLPSSPRLCRAGRMSGWRKSLAMNSSKDQSHRLSQPESKDCHHLPPVTLRSDAKQSVSKGRPTGLLMIGCGKSLAMNGLCISVRPEYSSKLQAKTNVARELLIMIFGLILFPSLTYGAQFGAGAAEDFLSSGLRDVRTAAAGVGEDVKGKAKIPEMQLPADEVPEPRLMRIPQAEPAVLRPAGEPVLRPAGPAQIPERGGPLPIGYEQQVARLMQQRLQSVEGAIAKSVKTFDDAFAKELKAIDTMRAGFSNAYPFPDADTIQAYDAAEKPVQDVLNNLDDLKAAYEGIAIQKRQRIALLNRKALLEQLQKGSAVEKDMARILQDTNINFQNLDGRLQGIADVEQALTKQVDKDKVAIINAEKQLTRHPLLDIHLQQQERAIFNSIPPRLQALAQQDAKAIEKALQSLAQELRKQFPEQTDAIIGLSNRAVTDVPPAMYAVRDTRSRIAIMNQAISSREDGIAQLQKDLQGLESERARLSQAEATANREPVQSPLVRGPAINPDTPVASEADIKAARDKTTQYIADRNRQVTQNIETRTAQITQYREEIATLENQKKEMDTALNNNLTRLKRLERQYASLLARFKPAWDALKAKAPALVGTLVGLGAIGGIFYLLFGWNGSLPWDGSSTPPDSSAMTALKNRLTSMGISVDMVTPGELGSLLQKIQNANLTVETVTDLQLKEWLGIIVGIPSVQINQAGSA